MASNKVSVEKFLVADGNAAVVADGATAFITDSTGVVNLSNEQLGIFDADTNIALNSGTGATAVPRIFIAQGTSTSATPMAAATSPLYNRPFEKSQVISPLSGRVTVTKRAGNATVLSSSWVIGEADGQTDEVNVDDNTLYEAIINFRGNRTEMLNARNMPAIYPQFTTPDYTNSTVYTSEGLRRDHLLASFVDRVNRESQIWPNNRGGAEVIALAVDAGAADANNGTTLTALSSAGVTFTVGYSAGKRVTYTTTTTFANTIAAIVANASTLGYSTIAGTSRVVPVLLSTAPSGSQAATDVTATTTSVAGTGTQRIDHVILVAIDQATAYYDLKAATKTTLDVGLPQGFSSAVQISEATKAFEGIGLGRQVELMYQSTDSLRKFDSVQPPEGKTFQFSSHVDTTATYDMYVIDHGSQDVTTSGFPSVSGYTTIVCIETADTTTSSQFEAAITDWAAGSTNIELINF